MEATWRLRIHRAPVFVLGCQKAGTTAISRLLAAATGNTYMYDVLYFYPKNPSTPLNVYVRRHSAQFAAAVNKDPNFTFLLNELTDVFPRARFVFVVRNPVQNVRSILTRLGLPGHLSVLESSQLKRVIDSGWYWLIESRASSGRCEGYVEAVAELWRRHAAVYLRESSRLLLTRYEDFLADKVGEIRRVAANAGLIPDREIAHMVDRQFQPRGDQSTDRAAFFGPENLAVIDSVCAEGMEKFGYG